MMKKAQAAMEFLMTYGWAILVVLVVIGALAYFGVLNPQTLLPERCELEQGVYCKDHQVTAATDTVTLRLENGRGHGIMIADVTAESEELGFTSAAGTACTVDFATGTPPPESWSGKPGRHIESGGASSINITCPNPPGIDSSLIGAGKKKFQLTVTWYSDDSDISFSHTMQGNLIANIE
jgi:hypothetical protein